MFETPTKEEKNMEVDLKVSNDLQKILMQEFFVSKEEDVVIFQIWIDKYSKRFREIIDNKDNVEIRELIMGEESKRDYKKAVTLIKGILYREEEKPGEDLEIAA